MGAHVPGPADLPDRQGGVRVTQPPDPHHRGRSRRGARVSHPSLKDSAADYLREQILTGQLTPGTKIDQDEISDALGVSRLPVREALIELANEGLVDAVPRRGAFVARLERADIVDHYRIFVLGRGAGGEPRRHLARPTRSSSSCAQVHESFVAATDADAQATWNHEFHKRINRAGGSRRLVSVLGAAVAQPAGPLLRVRARVGRDVGAATTSGSWLRSSSATPTRRSGSWSTT